MVLLIPSLLMALLHFTLGGGSDDSSLLQQQQPPPPVGAPIPVPIPVDIGPVDGSIKEAEGGKAGVGKPVKGNTVALAVYMEAQCPDTTGFVKRQLVPTWEKIGYTHRILLHLVPFGKAKCERKDGDIV